MVKHQEFAEAERTLSASSAAHKFRKVEGKSYFLLIIDFTFYLLQKSPVNLKQYAFLVGDDKSYGSFEQRKPLFGLLTA